MEYNNAVDTVNMARHRHENATVTAFTDVSIPDVLSQEWCSFIEAGEAYIRSSSLGDYPTEGAACTYCSQPLHASAVSRSDSEVS